MSHTFEKTVDNTTVVQLERASQIKELLTEQSNAPISPDVEKMIKQAALTEIIS